MNDNTLVSIGIVKRALEKYAGKNQIVFIMDFIGMRQKRHIRRPVPEAILTVYATLPILNTIIRNGMLNCTVTCPRKKRQRIAGSGWQKTRIITAMMTKINKFWF